MDTPDITVDTSKNSTKLAAVVAVTAAAAGAIKLGKVALAKRRARRTPATVDIPIVD